MRAWLIGSSLLIGLSLNLHSPPKISPSGAGEAGDLDTPMTTSLPPLRVIGGTVRKVEAALALHQGRSYQAWVKALARSWQGIPYGSGGAGTAPHQLLLNLDQMDCMTAVENIIALHRAYNEGQASLEGFAAALLPTRYQTYPPCTVEDRFHYLTHSFAAWEALGWGTWLSLGIPDTRPIHYISHHPQKYSGFTNWKRIRTVEQRLSARPRYYIPSQAIKDWLPFLQDGDLIALVSPQEGLDVSHIGIFFWEGEKPTFAHASLIAKKWVYGEDLCAYLDRRGDKVKGITVFRPF